MPERKLQSVKSVSGAWDGVGAGPMHRQGPNFAQRAWRPAGTVVAVGLAALLMWHVINGKHGLSVWQQKRVEDHQLQREITDLEQENAQLRVRIEKLKSDPDAIEHEAREKLHYAKPGEVIYSLPEAQGQAVGAGK
ncbi:MAG: septum formation initiator family protein [Terracidiphilus sp.]|jgi:cell division protein FtsB